MSTIKTDNIVPSDGTALNIGASGDTITVPTGANLVVTDGIASSSLILPTTTVAKGGTNLTSFTAGDLLYATGSTSLVKLAKGTAGQTLQMNGGASAPSWTTVSAAVTDLNPVIKSIATLALRDSVLHNLNAYALSNSFIDTFQDSSGIGSVSNTGRTSGEFVKCTGTYGTAVAYKPLDQGIVAGNSQSLTISQSDTRLQTSASGSGYYLLDKNNTYQNGGRHTGIHTLVQVGGGGGPGFYPGFVKNTIAGMGYNGNNYTAKSSTGFYKAGASGGAVGDKIRIVYDPAGNENEVVSHIHFAAHSDWTAIDSAYGSAFTSTTLSSTGMYHWATAYKDSGNDYIVDLAYTYEPFTPSATGNLISVATTAPSTVSKASLVISYFNTSGTAALNTDIKGYVSANNGTNWTQVTLTAGPLFSTGILTAVSDKVTISNTGTAMKYKIEWANQGVSKETRVDGVSLNY
jgi:hypothetical protein